MQSTCRKAKSLKYNLRNINDFDNTCHIIKNWNSEWNFREYISLNSLNQNQKLKQFIEM